MTEVITKSLYNGSIKLQFYPNSHRYKLEGSKTYLSSVTSITGMIDKSRMLIPWAVNIDFDYLLKKIAEHKSIDKNVLEEFIQEARNQHNIKKEEAADFGSLIHKFAEDFGKYKLGLNECPVIDKEWPKEVKNGVSAFIDWVIEHKVEFVECERFVYSKKLGYVGLFDALIKIDGKLFLVDYKSSKGIYNEMLYQVAAYCGAYIEETSIELDGAKIIKFGKDDGSLEIRDIEPDEVIKNIKAFEACLIIKNREKELSK